VGVTELAKHLGCTKGLVSMLAKRGMPTNSVDAANAWRAVNAPPRNRKDKADRPIPRPAPVPAPDITKSVSRSSPPPPVSNDTTPPIKSANTPKLSLDRAIAAEDAAHQKLKQIELGGGSIEDYRKANAVYISARNNRVKAQKDFDEWQRVQQITIFTSEGLEFLQRILLPVRQMAEVMPKTMSARLAMQPQKVIEKTLFEWSARLIENAKDEIWPRALKS
jgi:hypothetical protein